MVIAEQIEGKCARMHSQMMAVIRTVAVSLKQLLITDLVYKTIAFVLLTPLVAGLLRLSVKLSGSPVISDLEILYFMIGPVGWISVVVIGALWLAIFILGQTSLLAIVGAKRVGKELRTIDALMFGAAHVRPVIQLAARFVVWLLVSIVPFLITAVAIYWLLLGAHDINFYLSEKPREYWIAVSLGIALALVFVVFLFRMVVGWFYAVPILIFEQKSARESLTLSIDRVRGNRQRLLIWLIVWVLVATSLSMLGTALIGFVGRLLIPDATENLRTLTLALGAVLIVIALLNLFVNLLSGIFFTAMIFVLYENHAPAIEDIFGREGGNVEGRKFRWTQRRLIAAALICFLASTVVAASVLQGIRVDDDVEIMAHRGSSKAAPENTIAAFRKAIDDGADWIELDVQEDADGNVVVLHDSDFMKTAGNSLKIWDATHDEINEIDIGSWFGAEFSDERVPLLAEVLEVCKGKIGVNIELKYYGREVALEKRVVQVVEKAGMEDEVMVMSLKMDGVRAMRELRPDWRIGLLMSVAAGNLEKLDVDFLAVNAAFADQTLIRRAHKTGKEVYVWTVNDGPTMSAMISRGVDGLLTDKPALARVVLDQRSNMSVPERLLLEFAGLMGSVPEIAEQ